MGGLAAVIGQEALNQASPVSGTKGGNAFHIKEVKQVIGKTGYQHSDKAPGIKFKDGFLLSSQQKRPAEHHEQQVAA